MVDSSCKQRIAGYKGIFTAPPRRTPTRLNPDGPLMGNGDLGVVLAARAPKLRFLISKNDFWEARTPYPQGGPRLIGGVDISCEQLAGATYHGQQHIDTAHVQAEFAAAATGLTLQIKSWTPASANLLIIELTAAGAPANLSVKLWAQQARQAINRSGADARCAWVTREFSDAGLLYACQAAMAMRCVEGTAAAAKSPSDAQAPAQEMSLSLAAGESAVLAVAVATNFDNESYLTAAQESVIAVDRAKIESLRQAHQAWWDAFWAESFVDVGDELIEKYYYGAQYVLAYSSRNKEFPPGLFGNWTTTDDPAWAGDYHLNYNHQAPWWGVYSSNHVSLSDPYDTPILQYMPTARQNARKYLNCRGVYYEVGIGPRGMCATLCDPNGPPDVAECYPYEDGHLFLGQKSNAVFCAANMLMRFDCTLDLDYARLVYPFLTEVADFWEDYLKFEDGRYVIYKDAYSEVGPWPGEGWQKIYDEFNPTTTLGLLRMLLAGLLEMSQELGRDEQRRAKWRHILEHLSEFPLAERDGRTVMLRAEKGRNAGLHGGPYILNGTVFPAGVVSPRKTPRLAEILRQEAATWVDKDWLDHGNGFNTTFPGAARLGVDPQFLLTMLRKKLTRDGMPNLWVAQAGGGIETCAGITACINEMLLQSYEGVVRLFANWPKDAPARFENLRAVGAFLVCGQLKDGLVRGVTLMSEKGRPCALENPWPGREMKVTQQGQSDRAIGLQWQGSVATFETQAGGLYRVEPC